MIFPSSFKKKQILLKDLMNGYSILDGAKYFTEDGSQNYLVFQPVLKYFQTFTGTDKNFAWKSKRLSEESIEIAVTSDNSFPPRLNFICKIKK